MAKKKASKKVSKKAGKKAPAKKRNAKAEPLSRRNPDNPNVDMAGRWLGPPKK